MKKKLVGLLITSAVSLSLFTQTSFAKNKPSDKIKASPNGIEIPEDYQSWGMISSLHRIDNHSLRVILGNDIAVKASRNGKTNPWPGGRILAKMV